MPTFPAPETGILLTHFIVTEDIARSRDFYADVLGGEVVSDSEPAIVALANSWIIINTGGRPTDDKPTVTLTTPDPNTISSFLNIRVANIQEVYDDWSAKGAQFVTPPIDRGAELRCYLRDPDDHLIEVGQANLAFLEEQRSRRSAGAGETVEPTRRHRERARTSLDEGSDVVFRRHFSRATRNAGRRADLMPTALVIGARNLGFAVIERLLSDGWTVAGAARSPETLEKVRNAGAEALDVDVTDQASVLAALQDLSARHGRVDLAVNAASPYGGSRSGPFGGGPLAKAAPTTSTTGRRCRRAARSVFSALAPAS